MGYRSDVKVALKKDAFHMLNQSIKDQAKAYYETNEVENKWAEEYIKEGFLAHGYLTPSPHDGEVIFCIDSIKWDRWYKDVNWFYNALDYIADTAGYGYILVRIGEDGQCYTNSNFDIDCPEFDGEEPIGKGNVEPIETLIYTEVNFVIE